MKEKLRLGFYLASLAVAFVGAILVVTGKITQATADGWAAQVAQIAGWFGLATPAIAGWNLNKQIKGEASRPTLPEEMVTAGVNQIRANDQALKQAKAVATGALSNLVKDVPVLGPEAKQALDRILR